MDGPDSDANGIPAFYIFRHAPFQRGEQGEETHSPIIENLLCQYPPTIPEHTVIRFFSALISLYTYTTLSLNAPTVDFLASSESHIAMRTHQFDSPDPIFFVLQVASTFSEHSVVQTLDFIKDGILFALGPAPTVSGLREYIGLEGGRIYSLFIQSALQHPLKLALPTIQHANWHRSSIITTLTLMCTVRSHPEVLGICCFCGANLLASHTPIDVIRLFDFVSPSNSETRVFLSLAIRGLLQTDISDAVLHCIKHENIAFFVLTPAGVVLSPEVTASLTQAATHVSEEPRPDIVVRSENTLVYDCKLRTIALESVPAAALLAVVAHGAFLSNPRWRELLIQTPEDFVCTHKVLSLEAFAFLGYAGQPFAKLYADAIAMNPEVERFLKTFNPLPQSILD
jgi:hypothetical protein